MIFLQFYLQKYLDSISFKRVIFINYLKWHNFIYKRIFNSKEKIKIKVKIKIKIKINKSSISKNDF